LYSEVTINKYLYMSMCMPVCLSVGTPVCLSPCMPVCSGT